MLIGGLAAVDLGERIPQEHLVDGRAKNCGGHVDQDRDPAVVPVREGLAAKEDGRHDPAAQVPGQVGRDGDGREAPDHDAVGQSDHGGGGSRGDEGVGGIKAGPDDQGLLSFSRIAQF